MGEKQQQKKKKEEEEEEAVVLKLDMHCDGCASKIVRYLRNFQGVESVKAESKVGKLTITGKVDPSKVRENLSQKMKKKVDLISPHPNKDKGNTTTVDKTPKEAPVTTVLLKVALHCQGCIQRIHNTAFKTKGVQNVAIDKEKEMVTVKGTMDAKALVGNLMKRLKRKVEVVPPKKEKDNKDNADMEKDGAADKGGGGGGAKKKKGGGGSGRGDTREGGQGEGKMEQIRKEYMEPVLPYGYSCGYDYGYNNNGPLYMGQVHAPQIFSDENPNACSVM